MSLKKISSCLISVFYKTDLDKIVSLLKKNNVQIYATGGTLDFISKIDDSVLSVESLTGYPSILGGRVKTLHPKVFGGILGRLDNESDVAEMSRYEIPAFDLVIVDLYPFEETVANTSDEAEIIEKIDIGGISLIRAAAKNFNDVAIVASKNQYDALREILKTSGAATTIDQRRWFAREAFAVSSSYDTAIFNYFCGTDCGKEKNAFRSTVYGEMPLRYGENPHQKGSFYGDFSAIFEQLHGKEISYNNLLDIDAAVALIADFEQPTFAILKHNNACGVASRDSIHTAWIDALAGDPVSAFGGVLVANRNIDKATAEDINKIFFEVIIAPGYSEDALQILFTKKNRIVLLMKETAVSQQRFRSALNGVLVQDTDLKTETPDDLKQVTNRAVDACQIDDLLFANKIVKHSKSNAIVLAKNRQLFASGVGQTSRVDALKQAIAKAESFGFDLKGAVMASDAFFPFADCVEIADKAGITAVIQPGGSVRDQETIDYCNAHDIAMVMTGFRHFKH